MLFIASNLNKINILIKLKTKTYENNLFKRKSYFEGN